MPNIYYSNFTLVEGTEYFLYVGELKNYGLNLFLKEALTRNLNRKFDFIAIVPDIFEQYNYSNIIVINPQIDAYTEQYGPKVCCRVSAPEFIACVSANQKIRTLIKKILLRQSQLFIYMYESLPALTLDEIPGVILLGPDKHIAHKLNDKCYQFQQLKGRLPMVDFATCRGLADLIQATAPLWEKWQDGIVVSKAYSAAGAHSIVARNPAEIGARFQDVAGDFLITRYVPHAHDPTVLAVVAGVDDIYVAGVADQRIIGGTRFTGSTFPTVLAPTIVDRLTTYTREVGRWLAQEGYRGIFGVDFLVTDENDIRFLEINARKQGTTLEFCCTLEQSLPLGSPTLTELEFYAVTEGHFPINAVEMNGNPRTLHWGTFNYKMDCMAVTDGFIPQNVHEREAFGRVASGNLQKDFLILEHTGSDFVVAQGAFVGRIVALGHDHRSVQQGLKQGKRTIELTLINSGEMA